MSSINWCYAAEKELVGVPVDARIYSSSKEAYLRRAYQLAQEYLSEMDYNELPYDLQEAVEEYNAEDFEKYVNSLTRKLKTILKKAGIGMFEHTGWEIPSEGVGEGFADIWVEAAAKIEDPSKLIHVLKRYCDELDIGENYIYCNYRGNTIEITFETDVPIDKFFEECANVNFSKMAQYRSNLKKQFI